MMELCELRRQLRSQRRNLDEREHACLSDCAVAHLARHRLFRAARHIACYLPNDGELDLSDLILRCWDLGKTVYLPVLSHIYHNRLHFLPYRATDKLIGNRFGILEPEFRPRRMVSMLSLDLVLTPLVGFDALGNRLGMGGGFYDRSFAFLRHRKVWKKPHFLGVAFDFQQVDRQGGSPLSRQPWDVPLKGVVTESGVKRFSVTG